MTDKTTGNALANAQVVIYSPLGKVLVALCIDKDGYDMYPYKHKAKSGTYTVKLLDYNKSTAVTVKANGFAAIDFVVP